MGFGKPRVLQQVGLWGVVRLAASVPFWAAETGESRIAFGKRKGSVMAEEWLTLQNLDVRCFGGGERLVAIRVGSASVREVGDNEMGD